jgi:UDP-N-acetyl-D-glucosamine dehydrogenase
MENQIKEFKKRIFQKKIKIAVVGLGYVGLPLALEFAKKGFAVLGIEIDRDRLAHIQRKESYITDISTKELRKVLAKATFSASSDFGRLKEIDVIIICVPTPLKRKYHPNISYIRQAVESIAKNIKKPSLVILESTTYPGTTEEVILPLLKQRGLKHNQDFYLCFSPERIDPGNKIYTVDKIPKVVGGVSREAAELASLVYGNIIEKVVPVSSARTAEAVKLLENTFRLINIGLIDELAMMAHKMKIDIWEVIQAAKTKPFGFMPFYPGPGVGGHCIPKDPLYLYWKAKVHGFKPRFIKLASDVITAMPEYVVWRLEDILAQEDKALADSRILAVGITYKKDIKDLRKSPGLDVLEILHKRHCRIGYYDPLIPYLKWNHLNLKSIDWNARKLGRFDCAVILAEHSRIDYAFLLRHSRRIFDTRNVYKGKCKRKVIRL